MNTQEIYPQKSIRYEIRASDPIKDDDLCINSCAENQRGFENNRIYHLGLELGMDVSPVGDSHGQNRS